MQSTNGASRRRLRGQCGVELLQRVAVIPREPRCGAAGDRVGVALQGGKVVERIGTVQLARVDQTHEEVADLGPVRRFVEERVFPVQNRPFERSFDQRMPRPGLCRHAHLVRDVSAISRPTFVRDAA
jgi:hypothetical protein